jgi:hypothetical protein
MNSVGKVTLAAATVTKIVTGQPGSRTVLFRTALTDCALGGASVTVASGYPFPAAPTNVSIPIGSDDLYAISTGGGDVFFLVADNG